MESFLAGRKADAFNIQSANFHSVSERPLLRAVPCPVQGVFVDSDGNLAEGPNMNMIILTQEGELLVCHFTLSHICSESILELFRSNLMTSEVSPVEEDFPTTATKDPVALTR